MLIKKIDDQKLIEYMKEHPDRFLSEIARYFNLTPQAIFYVLKRLRITRKKTALYQERNEAIRESFKAELEKIPLDQRIYLDESGINKYLYREHARSLRGKFQANNLQDKVSFQLSLKEDFFHQCVLREHVILLSSMHG